MQRSLSSNKRASGQCPETLRNRLGIDSSNFYQLTLLTYDNLSER